MNLLDGADLNTDPREDILNKWKDKPAEDVLKAKVEADLHIKVLEREKAELRQMYLEKSEELQAKAKLEEYIDQLKGIPNRDNLQTPPAGNEVEDSHKFDPREIESLLDKKFSDYEKQKQETENYHKVENKLRERYGDNFAIVLKDQQALLGLSTEEINNLAKRSPEAFFRMVGLNDSKNNSFQAPPRTNQRNDSYAPRVQRRDYNYYQELKKTNPKLYLDPKIALQMEKDAQELGDSFFPD